MELVNNALEFLVPFAARVFIFVFLTIKIGIIQGIVLSYLIFKSYSYFMLAKYNYISLTGFDKIFLAKSPKIRYQIISIMRFSNFNREKLVKFIKEEQLAKIPRFRYLLKKKFLEYWWYEGTLEAVYKKIKYIPQRINNEAELTALVQKEINDPIDVFNDLLFEFQIYPFGDEKDNQGILLLKYDHLLTDGLGLIGTVCCTASNYSIDSFPVVMKNMKHDPWYKALYYWLVYPYYVIQGSLYFIFIQRNPSPFFDRKGGISGKTLVASSKDYKLKDFDDFRKPKNLTFNDLMINVLSLATKEMIDNEFDGKFKDKKLMRIMIPLGRKPLPRNVSELDMENKANGVFCNVPLISDITDENLKKVKKNLRKLFTPELQSAYMKSVYILGEFFTWMIQGLCSKGIAWKMEVAFSNVPGPTQKIKYGDQVCEYMLSFCSSGKGLAFLPLLSYNGQFNFSLNLDENCAVKPEVYIKYMEKQLDKILSIGK